MEDASLTDSKGTIIENEFRSRSVLPGLELYLGRSDAIELIHSYQRYGMAVARVEGFLVRLEGLCGSTAMIADFRSPRSNEAFRDYMSVCNRFAIDAVLNMVVSGDLALFRAGHVSGSLVGTIVFSVVALSEDEIVRPPIELDLGGSRT